MGRHRDRSEMVYRRAWSWPASVERFLLETIREERLLNVCSGRTCFGTIRVDKYHPDAQVRADWLSLPFADNSFDAVFSDPPWYAAYMADCAGFVREALRIAPVLYLMAPWTYGAARAVMTDCWVRQQVGVKPPLLLSRYERRGLEMARRQAQLLLDAIVPIDT